MLWMHANKIEVNAKLKSLLLKKQIYSLQLSICIQYAKITSDEESNSLAT